MRSPAPSAERIDSITVSTAVAALARGISARPTTRSTMSALIISAPPGPLGELYLSLFEADGRNERGRRGGGELPHVRQIQGARSRPGEFGVEKGHCFVLDEDRLDQAFVRAAAERLHDGV